VEEAKKALIVDNEQRLRHLMCIYLEREGFKVEEETSGWKALEKALTDTYNIIMVDITLPDMNGIEICKALRKEKSTPLVMLTKNGEEHTRIQAFEAGADDYITKPFSPREVILRIKAILRRTEKDKETNIDFLANNLIVFPDLFINLDAHRVTANEQTVTLTPKEYKLLVFLAEYPDTVHSREELLEKVWEYESFDDPRTVDTHIKRLREKLYTTSKRAGEMIVTDWGVGYKLTSGNLY